MGPSPIRGPILSPPPAPAPSPVPQNSFLPSAHSTPGRLLAEAEVRGGGPQALQTGPLQLLVLGARGHVMSGAGAHPGAFQRRPTGLRCAEQEGFQLRPSCAEAALPGSRGPGAGCALRGCSWRLRGRPLGSVFFLVHRELLWVRMDTWRVWGEVWPSLSWASPPGRAARPWWVTGATQAWWQGHRATGKLTLCALGCPPMPALRKPQEDPI